MTSALTRAVILLILALAASSCGDAGGVSPKEVAERFVQSMCDEGDGFRAYLSADDSSSEKYVQAWRVEHAPCAVADARFESDENPEASYMHTIDVEGAITSEGGDEEDLRGRFDVKIEAADALLGPRERYYVEIPRCARSSDESSRVVYLGCAP